MPFCSQHEITGRQSTSNGVGPLSYYAWFGICTCAGHRVRSVDDRVIWQYAAENDLVIVTKDEDFQAFANRQRGKSPQVIWVRIGNCRKVALLAVFYKILPELRDLLISGQPVIEIR